MTVKLDCPSPAYLAPMYFSGVEGVGDAGADAARYVGCALAALERSFPIAGSGRLPEVSAGRS